MLSFGQFVIDYMSSAEFPHISNNRVKQSITVILFVQMVYDFILWSASRNI